MSDQKSLYVRQSLNKAGWRLPEVSFDDVAAAARAHDLPEIVARMLLARGIEASQIPSFLNPTLRDHMPDPFSMAGMKDMADFAALAIMDGRKHAIFGDFDVDGATSSALLYRFLKMCGVEARIYIPDRLEEGYGPNEGAFQTLKNEGADVVYVLDCGITAFEIIQKGRDMGLEIVIFDHHEAEEKLPAANHVINPKRKDDASQMQMLAAVGVTFMSCVAINSRLREKGFFEGQAEPDLKSLLDLVCLGTVCDMVPLTGVNRLLVRHGFSAMNRTKNTGIKALAEVAGIFPPFNSYHLGFGLGPRINAGGRIHKSELGALLLSTEDEEEAKNIAWTLNDCNDKRRDIQAQMESEAISKVEQLGLHQYPAIVVDDEEWHPGLAGLVAGRLKDAYDKPACVVTYTRTGEGGLEGRGSGRSVPGVHIAETFIDARNEGLLVKGGGHAMAGGFTIEPDKLVDFKNFVYLHVKKQREDAAMHVITEIDSLLSVSGITVKLATLLEEYIGPFGQSFEEPLFALENVRINSCDIMGEKHIKLMISDWEGGSRIKAVAFGAVGTPMGEAFIGQGRQGFNLLGQIKVNRWQGRESAEFHIKDAAFAMGQEQRKRGAL